MVGDDQLHDMSVSEDKTHRLKAAMLHFVRRNLVSTVHMKIHIKAELLFCACITFNTHLLICYVHMLKYTVTLNYYPVLIHVCLYICHMFSC